MRPLPKAAYGAGGHPVSKAAGGLKSSAMTNALLVRRVGLASGAGPCGCSAAHVREIGLAEERLEQTYLHPG